VRRPLVASLALLLAPLALVASSGSTPPGTPTQVKTLVAASTHIKALTTKTAAQITNLDRLNADYYFRGDCSLITACVYGDTASKTVVVLFGDSHALMWMPAAVLAAKKLGVKVIDLSKRTCPIALLTDPVYLGGQQGVDCATWRSSSIAAIQALDPRLVVLSERTARVVDGQGNVPYTKAQWQAGLQATITALQSSTTRVAVIEDLTSYTNFWPSECLAAYPKSVQSCSIPDPNPKQPGQQAAEQAAAKATGATYIPTDQWFCTTRCSPIVGSFLTHYDWTHVSVPYARYLSGVFATALKKALA
jgi:hypothetical protein